MRKFLSIILLLTLTIVACSKDEEINPEGLLLLSYSSNDDLTYWTTTFIYNTDMLVEEETIIKKDIAKDSIYAIYKYINTYHNKFLVKKELYTNDILDRVTEYNYDKDKIKSIIHESNNNNVKRFGVNNIEYNDDGKIIKEAWTTNVNNLDKDTSYVLKGKRNYYYLSENKYLKRVSSDYGGISEIIYEVDINTNSPICLTRTEAENKLSPLGCYNALNYIKTQRSNNNDIIYYSESTFDYKFNKYDYPTEKIQKLMSTYSTSTTITKFTYNK